MKIGSIECDKNEEIVYKIADSYCSLIINVSQKKVYNCFM